MHYSSLWDWIELCSGLCRYQPTFVFSPPINHPLANPEETRRFSKQSNAMQDSIHRHASSFDKQINPHCKCVDIPRIFYVYTVARPHCRLGKGTVLNECSRKYLPSTRQVPAKYPILWSYSCPLHLVRSLYLHITLVSEELCITVPQIP